MAIPSNADSVPARRRWAADSGPRPPGLFLHASAVFVEGGACLFLGHSTAGKSTIARLLEPHFPILADDSVYAAKPDAGPWRVVDGSFRFGRDELPGWQEEICRRAGGAGAVPLRGCFRIHKADAVRIEPLDPMELARCLMDAVMEIDLQRKFGQRIGGAKPEADSMKLVREMRRQWFSQVAHMARVCSGWALWFSKDSNGAELRTTLSRLEWDKSH